MGATASCTSRDNPSFTVQDWVGQRGKGFLIAHRGAGDVVPEHTIEAYEAAVGWGAKALEISVARLSDDVLICHHDLTFDRTTNLKGKVSDFSSAVLTDARVDIPRLGPRWQGRPPQGAASVRRARSDGRSRGVLHRGQGRRGLPDDDRAHQGEEAREVGHHQAARQRVPAARGGQGRRLPALRLPRQASPRRPRSSSSRSRASSTPPATSSSSRPARAVTCCPTSSSRPPSPPACPSGSSQPTAARRSRTTSDSGWPELSCRASATSPGRRHRLAETPWARDRCRPAR